MSKKKIESWFEKMFKRHQWSNEEIENMVDFGERCANEREAEILEIIDWIDGDVDNHDWIIRKELIREIKKLKDSNNDE